MVGVLIRILLLLASFVVLYGCGQASSPVEKQEKKSGVEQAQTQKPSEGGEETTTGTVGNIPISGVIGETIETPAFEYRILDLFETDHYYYLENPSVPFEQDAFSEAGRFVVVNYSMTNTSPEPVNANLGARLHTRAGDKIEVYEETDQFSHPHSGGIIGGPELAPREVLLGQFIFDVPTDVEPELLVVLFEDEVEEPRGEAGNVDLTREDPQGPRPEEILALQYQYYNMTAWQQAYDLFDQSSKERVPFDQFEIYFEQGTPTSVTEYAFPSVNVQGDRATIERVFTLTTPDDEYQAKSTQEAVLEDEGWRMVMRDDQVRDYTSAREGTN